MSRRSVRKVRHYRGEAGPGEKLNVFDPGGRATWQPELNKRAGRAGLKVKDACRIGRGATS